MKKKVSAVQNIAFSRLKRAAHSSHGYDLDMEIEQMPWVSCRCPISICVAARKRAYFSSFSAIGPILWKVMRELVA
jgi:hypothetical protein